jgi:hypothetical protein
MFFDFGKNELQKMIIWLLLGEMDVGNDQIEFLKFETRWDCRSYRIYGVRCHAA